MLRTTHSSRPKELNDLLAPELAARLAQLDITSRKVFSGKLKGERRSKRRGESVEFADHRPYVSGDDLRHIDWNIYGRLDRLFLKLFLEEEDLSLHIVVDCSGSMDCGEPNKFLFAQRLAASLGYIGLVNLNRVAVSAIGSKDTGFEEAGTGGVAGAIAAGLRAGETGAAAGPGGATGLVSTLRDLRGKRRLQDLSNYLMGLQPIGGTRFTDGCKRVALSRRGKGIMVLISDFMVKDGYETGLRLLKGHGYDLFAIQVLSPQEMNPTIGGDLRLKDIEDGDTAEVTISAALLKKYQQTLNAYCNRLHEFCAQRDIMHMSVKSDMAIDTFVLDYLRRRGLLR